MGNCLKRPQRLPSPTDFVLKTRAELDAVLKTQLRTTQTNLADGNYACLTTDDVKRFLSSDVVDKIKYKKESFDCDDFAKALAGRASEWFAAVDTPSGMAFGIVHGDIRKDETSTESRPHAINFFVDHNAQVWLIEPQTDNIFQLTSNSTVWMVWC